MAPLSAEEHAIALFNTEIFLGTISSAGTPIQVSESGSEAIYVPVDVEISEAFRGTGSPSTTVRLRMLSDGPTLRSVIDYGSGNHEVDRQPFLDLLRNLP